jgi:tetratricopeptide (TPR) repeat protein
VTTSPGTNSDRELDARLLRFRTQPASKDVALLAADLLTAGRAHDSLDILLTALREAPDNPTLLVLEGRAHYASGDFLRAQTALLKAAHVAPKNKEPFRWLGEVLLKRGDPERAVKALERARALDEHDSSVAALHARAERLSRIARAEGIPDSEPPDAEPDVHEERTVVAPPSRALIATSTDPLVNASLEPSWPEEATRVNNHQASIEVHDTISEHIGRVDSDDAQPTPPTPVKVPPPRKSRWRRFFQVSASVLALAIAGGAGVHYYARHQHQRAVQLPEETRSEEHTGEHDRIATAEIARDAMDREGSDEAEQVARAGREALSIGTSEAVNQAASALERYLEAHDDASIELRALHIRLSFSNAPPAHMLAAARELAAANRPGDPIANMILGEAALRAGDANVAAEALTSVIEANPLDAEAHHLLGRARYLQGDGNRARQSMERAIELQPENSEFKQTLGLLLLDLGDYEGAHRICRELPKPTCLIESLIGLGHLDQAQTELESLSDPREIALTRISAARLALVMGRSTDAVSELRAVLATEEHDTRTPKTLTLYGDALLAAGDINASATAFAEALARDPEFPEALIGRAELYIRGDHPRDAAPLLERAGRALRVRIRPPSVRSRKLMLDGRVAFLAHDLLTARTRLREAIALAGVPTETYFHLGEALSGENAPEARAAYARYLELAPEGFFANRARRAIGER